MKKILSFFICALVFISCSKEEYIIGYPTTFTSTKFSGQNIRVFTKNGEIKNTEIKSKLIERAKQYLTNLETTNIENDITVTYVSESNVEFNSMSSSFNKMLNMYETPEVTYWERQDTTKSVIEVYDFNGNHNKYQPFYLEVLGHNPLINSTLIETKECFYAKKKGKMLVMPYFDKYHIGYYNIYNYVRAAQGINNAFIYESYSKLGEKDTLLIQEFNVELHIKD